MTVMLTNHQKVGSADTKKDDSREDSTASLNYSQCGQEWKMSSRSVSPSVPGCEPLKVLVDYVEAVLGRGRS